MTLRFWQGWPRNNRIFLLLFSIVFVIAIANMWVAYFVQPSPAIELQTVSEPDIAEVPVDQFSKGPFDFTVRGNNYVIIQRELGSMLEVNETVAYTYLFVLAVFVIGMLAVISTLGRFYYLVCMGVFILFVTSLSTELLGVLGIFGKTFTILVMALYGMASFWLFYFAVGASFLVRVLVFSAITFFLWLMIFVFATVPKPFLFMSAYSTEAGLLACGLFIATVSHEIVASFVFAATQSPKQRKSLNHFLIITVIYLINLVLAYAVRFGFIQWDIITVDLFLLLSISAVLGFWGIRQRQKTFEGIIDADPYAVFAFVLMGAFTFATIAMFMYSGNDTALSAISDVIIFTHIGFGVIFLTYILSNFGGMLSQNMQVHKVMYSANNMPFFTFRFAGLITTLALVFYNAWQVPVHNAMSGYFNAIGDVHYKLDEKQIAQAYYDRSRTYGFRGHHSNYALANLEGSVMNAEDENRFYGDASRLRPTQMSYLNWAQTYQAADDNLQAILTLADGVKKVDEHNSIENTLGILYARAGVRDSASKYLGRSGYASNIVGLAAFGRIPVPDSTLENNDPIMRVNQLALANSLGRVSDSKFELPADTVLTLAQAAGISNYLINSRNNEDTTFVKSVITLARRPSNSGFKEALLFASSIALYNSGEIQAAFTALEEVTVGSDHQGKYNNVLTMWALENDEPQRAFGYSDYAVSQKYAAAYLTNAVALTESGRFSEAVVAWDSLRHGPDTTTTTLAGNIYNALSVPANLQTTLNDDALYAHARYKYSMKDSSAIFSLINHFQDDNLKAKTLLDLAQKCYAADKPGATLNILQRVVGLELTDARIGEQMQVLEMLARVRTGSVAMVIDAMKQNPVQFKGKQKKYQVYFDALAAEAAGDSTKANSYYHWLAKSNPYFEDGQIGAANYFRNKGITSYNMLAEALLHHPSSVRLRKAYALESARQGFDSYATAALEDLKSSISAQDHAALSKQVDALLSKVAE